MTGTKKQIAERLTNSAPSPEETELTEHLMEQRERLRRIMQRYPKEQWPDMAAFIDAALSFDAHQGKPN